MHLFTCTALAASVAALAPAAQATLTLELFDGTTTITVVDGSADDGLAAPGSVLFAGAIGGFETSITVGVSNSPGNALTGGQLDLTSLNIDNVGSGPAELQVRISDDNFTLPAGGSELQSFFSVSRPLPDPANSFTFDSSVDDANNLFGSSITAPQLTLTGNGSSSSSAPIAVTSPYSLTSTLNITLGAGSVLTATGNTTVVPEPASMALVGLGLTSLLARRRRG